MHAAATKIQAVVRGFLTRIRTEDEFWHFRKDSVDAQLRDLTQNLTESRLTFGSQVQAAAILIQRRFKGYKTRKLTSGLISERRTRRQTTDLQAALTIETWVRARLALIYIREKVNEKITAEKLLAIRKNLAVLTIRKLLYAVLVAYKQKKAKAAKKRLRRNLRLEALLQKQKSSQNVLQPGPQFQEMTPRSIPQVPAKMESVPLQPDLVPEIEGVAPDDLSISSYELVPIQPLGKSSRGWPYCRPTFASLEYSAKSVVIRQSPKVVQLTKIPEIQRKRPGISRRYMKTVSPRAREQTYLNNTESSQLRYNKEYRFPTSFGSRRKHFSRAFPETLQKPTTAWTNFTAYRRAVREGLSSREKEPRWHYVTRYSGLETQPGTPLRGDTENNRRSALPGRHRAVVSEVGDLGSAMEESEDRMMIGPVSMSVLS